MARRFTWLILVGLAEFAMVVRSPAQLLGHVKQNVPRNDGASSGNHRAPGLTCSIAPCQLLNEQPSADEANTPVIAVDPQNPLHLLTGATDYACASYLGFNMSADGGASWNHTCLLSAGGFQHVGDPALTYGNGGKAYAAGPSGYDNDVPSIFIESSTDNGVTWDTPALVEYPLFNNGVANAPWMQADNGLGSPYVNAVYVSATQFDARVVESQISVSHSTDGGNTWTTTTVDPVQVKPIVDQFSRSAIGSDGTVYVAWQRCAMIGPNINCADTKAQMLLSKSADGGNTWSAPVTIATVHLVPDTCDCSFFGNLPLTNEPVANMPVIGIDNSQGPHAGYLYAVMYNWTGTQMKVEVATSKDGGDTWNKPVVVAPAAKHDEFFPSLSVSPSGKVGVSWLDRRNDPLNVSYQPFAAISTNGGASFTKSYAVTPVLSDPYLDGNGGTYMGDYTGNAWDTNNYFLVTWPDTRNQQFMQDYVGGFRLK